MTRPHNDARSDLYARVTLAIVADLEAGVRPWAKPWTHRHSAGPISRPLRATGEPYGGVNVLLLWSEALSRGFAAPIWMTFRQARLLGGHVRRGSRGATVVYASAVKRTQADEDGEETARSIRFLKAYTVFNVEQVDGLPGHFHAASAAQLDPCRRIDHAEAFFSALGADIRNGGDRAYYAPEPDYVQMPPFECFESAEAYYATLGHECVHWTGHPSRLGRDLTGRGRGDDAYAREELVAEIGAAFLCADLGLELTPRSDHARYIAGWLEVLKNDPRFIFKAAAQAQRACAHLHGLQAEPAKAT